MLSSLEDQLREYEVIDRRAALFELGCMTL
jgi:hypothetical protein